MSSFQDRDKIEWRVELDAPTIESIKADHGVNLVSLDNDPLGPLRNDPMLLVTVISALCREQIDAKGLSSVQFAKRLPSPPDPMLDALRDAVISFFPSGRASHIREVLEKFGQMREKTDELTTAKMAQVLKDPKVMAALEMKADHEINKSIESLLARNAGT